MEQFKNIIFDVDGVLIDSMPIWADSANLYLKEEFGIIAPPELDKECETLSLMESGELIKGYYPEITLSARELADGVAAFIKARYVKAPERPGMIKTVKTLFEKGYHLYLATASEEEIVRGVLTNLGVFDCFKDIYTCMEVGYSKSNTEYFKEVARRIGVPCEELIMIEDSVHSMETAKKAGLTVFGVYDDYSADKQDEVKAISDIYLNTLAEIMNFVS